MSDSYSALCVLAVAERSTYLETHRCLKKVSSVFKKSVPDSMSLSHFGIGLHSSAKKVQLQMVFEQLMLENTQTPRTLQFCWFKKKKKTWMRTIRLSDAQASGFTSKADWLIVNTALYKNTVENVTPLECHLHLGRSAFPNRKPNIQIPNPYKSSALLNHGTCRGGVQFFLNETETWTQFKCVPKGRRKAGSHKKKVPQAGPGGAILLKNKSQLKCRHHGGIVHDAFELLASLVQLQVDVENRAAQTAGLARCQPQDFTRYSPR